MIRRLPLQVLMDPDFLVLEEELGRRIRELRDATSPFTRILVVAPTQLLVLRLREAIAEREKAVLGVEILNFQALTYHILSGSGGPIPALASTPLLESVVREAQNSLSQDDLTEYARRRPAVVSALNRLMGELREAGVTPGDLLQDSLDPMAAQLSRLLNQYEAILERWSGTRGKVWTDRAGLTGRAIQSVSTMTAFEAVFVYGAHELVGMNLDLVRALPSQRGLTFLVPADFKAPSWDYAREFVQERLGVKPKALGETESRPFVETARSFGDPSRTRSIPLSETTLSLAHAQGPETELTLAARKALSWIQKGVPPWKIAIVGRSLESYASLGETIFARHGLGVNSSIALPLSRYPLSRSILLLLRALARDFERQVVIELARSPFLKRPQQHKSKLWRPGAWDQWSRAYGITRGFSAWVEVLPELVRTQPIPPWMEQSSPEAKTFLARREEDGDSANELADLIRTWDKDLERWKKCQTGMEHAEWLSSFVRHWIRNDGPVRIAPENEDIWSTWGTVLSELRGLCAIKSADGESSLPRASLSAPEVLHFLETSLEAATLPWRNPNGVHFLDFMQSRGLTFRHVVLIGFNDHLIPRTPRDRPFLSEAARERLRSRTGKMISVESTRRREEQLLFAQLVASTTESLTITWQRADAEGKVLSVSKYLRELSRVLPGSPPLTELLSGNMPFSPKRVPTHPGKAAAWFCEATGLVTREEGALLTTEADRGEPTKALQSFAAAQDPALGKALAPGLDLIHKIEQFDGDDLSYDGDIPGLTPWNRDFSDASLKKLGRCPLTFFFRYTLGVRPLEETIKDFRLDSRELGHRIHEILRAVFQDLDQQGLLNGDTDATTLIKAGSASLDRHWNSMQETLGRRIRLRFPLLYEHTQTAWRKELSAFLKADLERLADEGHRLDSLETSWNVTISLPRLPGSTSDDLFGPSLSITGIPDRVTRDSDGRRLISDYKMGGKLEKWVHPLEYLRGNRVQLPLYVLLAEGLDADSPVDAELLGLGPSFQPDRGFLRSGPITLDTRVFQGLKEGFVDTLAVLNSLSTEGRFPFNSDFRCIWCEFDSACRKNHFPTRQRVEHTTRFKDYFMTLRKIKKKPLLSDLDSP